MAYEIGVQFGGIHRLNGNTESCSGGNCNPSTAYEPGSSSTITSFAGICGSQNLQSNSDDYFLGISFDEILAFSITGVGNNCPMKMSK
jgi:hypothetical protein